MSSIADELKKLQNLLDSGVLSVEEFAQAKKAILHGNDARGASSISGLRIADLHLQSELFRVDEEWRAKQEHYKVTYGRRSVPMIPNAFGTVMSLIGGMIAISFGGSWIAQTFNRGAPALFPMFGLLMVVFGIGVSIYHVIKYLSYKSAFAEYQRRRSEVLTTFGTNYNDKA